MGNEKTVIDDIDVTTATRTVEDVEKSLTAATPPPAAAAPKPGEATNGKPVVPAAAAATTEGEDELTPEVIAELDQAIPPPLDAAGKVSETPEQQTARRSRAERKVLKEISKRKQAETDLQAERDKTRSLEGRIAAMLAGTPPPAKADDPATAAASTKPATDAPFKFPTWEDWQKEKPDAEYTDYVDARQDARSEFNDRKRSATAAQRDDETRTAAAFTDVRTAETEFKASTPDYDTVTANVKMVGHYDDKQQFVPSGGTTALQGELVRLGKNAPKMNYFLGQHPDLAKALMESETPRDFLVLWGQVVARAEPVLRGKPAAAPAPVVPEPPKPQSRAARPLEPARGVATHKQTLREVSQEGGDDPEDADAYIAARQSGLEA